MTILLAPLPVQSFKDANGNPLAGGQLYTYVAGTSTLQTTYTDSTGTTPNTNPIILNSRGECNLWLTSGQAYKLLLQDSFSVLVWSVDQIVSSAAASGANSDITSLLGLTTALSVAQGGTGGIDPVSARNGISASSDPFRNRVINGDMSVDQRNFASSQTIAAATALTYTVDRHYVYCTGANITTQQITAADGRNRLRLTGAASVATVGVGHRIEVKNSRDQANTTCTLSVKLSSTSLTSIGWAVRYASTADAFGTLASPTVTAISSGTFTITGTETVYSVQVAVPSAATTGIEIVLTGGALLASQTLTIGDFQFEKGALTTAAITPEVVDAAIQLMRCQRYFEKSYDTTVTSGAGAWQSIASTGSFLTAGTVRFLVPKRIAPTITYLSPIDGATGVMGEYNTGGGAVTNRTASLLGATTGGFWSQMASATVGNLILFHFQALAEL